MAQKVALFAPGATVPWQFSHSSPVFSCFARSESDCMYAWQVGSVRNDGRL